VQILSKETNTDTPALDSDFTDFLKPNEQEIKVFQLMRNLEYGEIRIVIKNSAVVQIEEKKSIKL